jgi:hypothetical protein
VKILPVMLFVSLISTYIGGWALDVRGGNGVTQVLGLLISGVLFVVTWRLLHTAFMGVGEVLGGIVITTFVTAFLLPVLAWIGFKVVGVSIQGAHGHAH